MDWIKIATYSDEGQLLAPEPRDICPVHLCITRKEDSDGPCYLRVCFTVGCFIDY